MANKEKEVKAKNKNQKNHYFKDMKAELKKVIWPSSKQLVTNTLGVIAFTLIIAVIVFVLDLGFDAINKYGITAAQEKIQSSYSKTDEESEEQDDEENEEEHEHDSEEDQEDESDKDEEIDVEDNQESKVEE